jgi:glucoamylase
MNEQMEETDGNDFSLSVEEYGEWMDLLNLVEGSTATDYIAAATAAGDSVMTRMWSHVKDDDGEIDEQMDRETGAQKSAKNLTWSYANVLNALHVRKSLLPY